MIKKAAFQQLNNFLKKQLFQCLTVRVFDWIMALKLLFLRHRLKHKQWLGFKFSLISVLRLMQSPIVQYTSDWRTGQDNYQLDQILEDRMPCVYWQLYNWAGSIYGWSLQDFILRPLLFKIFILPLVQIIENNNNINYTAFYPVDPCPIQPLGKCIKWDVPDVSSNLIKIKT